MMKLITLYGNDMHTSTIENQFGEKLRGEWTVGEEVTPVSYMKNLQAGSIYKGHFNINDCRFVQFIYITADI